MLFGIAFFFIFFLINKKLKTTIISLLTFLLGFNIAYNEIIPESYVMGSISNYRMLQIHLLDIIVLLVLIVVTYLLYKRKQISSITSKPLLVILSIFILQLLFSIVCHRDIVSTMWTSRVLLYFTCVVFVRKYLEIIDIKQKKAIFNSAFVGLLFALMLNLTVAIFQVIFSHSIGLTVLGESPIDKYSTELHY